MRGFEDPSFAEASGLKKCETRLASRIGSGLAYSIPGISVVKHKLYYCEAKRE